MCLWTWTEKIEYTSRTMVQPKSNVVNLILQPNHHLQMWIYNNNRRDIYVTFLILYILHSFGSKWETIKQWMDTHEEYKSYLLFKITSTATTKKEKGIRPTRSCHRCSQQQILWHGPFGWLQTHRPPFRKGELEYGWSRKDQRPFLPLEYQHRSSLQGFHHSDVPQGYQWLD